MAYTLHNTGTLTPHEHTTCKNQCGGSGAGSESVGAVCFRASRILIPILFCDFLNDLLSLKNDANVFLQKVISKKLVKSYFCCILEGPESDPDPDPVTGTDPRIRIRTTARTRVFTIYILLYFYRREILYMYCKYASSCISLMSSTSCIV